MWLAELGLGLGLCVLLYFPSPSCQVWDVTMQDLCSGAIKLDKFHGVAFVGGFSYADVLGSAKGWYTGFCSLPHHIFLKRCLSSSSSLTGH